MTFTTIIISEISLLLAISTTFFLILLELTSPHYGLSNLNINRKKLCYAGFSSLFLFLILSILKIVTILGA